jgi:hypothetical protein
LVLPNRARARLRYRSLHPIGEKAVSAPKAVTEVFRASL